MDPKPTKNDPQKNAAEPPHSKWVKLLGIGVTVLIYTFVFGSLVVVNNFALKSQLGNSKGTGIGSLLFFIERHASSLIHVLGVIPGVVMSALTKDELRDYFLVHGQHASLKRAMIVGGLYGLFNPAGYIAAGILMPGHDYVLLYGALISAYPGALAGVWIRWYTCRLIYRTREPLQFSLLGLLGFLFATAILLHLITYRT